jgi:hypothetical protein
MSENDPGALADELERDADKLEHENRRLEGEVSSTRQDWERKRHDPKVPGAQPPVDESETGDEMSSPAPQAPPEEAGPGEAETTAEGVGPPSQEFEENSED